MREVKINETSRVTGGNSLSSYLPDNPNEVLCHFVGRTFIFAYLLRALNFNPTTIYFAAPIVGLSVLWDISNTPGTKNG
ncbi:MAG: hypothetical protein JSS07_04500 [Proteobacteria bacterium]|nr:hypothetical protein [Pseudomonadota bacterium]